MDVLLLAQVEPEPNSGCWLWVGDVAQNGYGHVRYSDRSRTTAHRAVWEALYGPLPKTLLVDHRCRVRSCVNPRHLEPVTGRENLMRGPTLAATNAAKTHCHRGHALDADNTYRYKRGRACRTCRNAASSRALQRKENQAV